MKSKVSIFDRIKGCKVFFLISAVIFVFSLLVLVACLVSQSFASLYVSTVSCYFRFVLALVTSIFPFSIAEILVILLPICIIIAVVLSVVKCKSEKIRPSDCVLLWIGIIFCGLSLFLNCFGVCYFDVPVEKKLGLERTQLSEKQLYDDAVYTRHMILDVSGNVVFNDDGSSENPHSYAQTDKLINYGYSVLDKSGVFKSFIIGSSKKIMLSEPMTYSHISGMYFPFTGEANVNVNYPDYVVAFTIAHEKAHQRGIAKEDEANFVAFLALMASGDDYLKYSALMNMYDYYLEETFIQDKEMYNRLVSETDSVILREMYAYYKFFEKYSDSEFSKVADAVNDTYLKTMGDDDGVKSYGLVIELYHAYIKKEGYLYD